jgi:hypothetical protein
MICNLPQSIFSGDLVYYSFHPAITKEKKQMTVSEKAHNTGLEI